jgi:hypothetical protein
MRTGEWVTVLHLWSERLRILPTSRQQLHKAFVAGWRCARIRHHISNSRTPLVQTAASPRFYKVILLLASDELLLSPLWQMRMCTPNGYLCLKSPFWVSFFPFPFRPPNPAAPCGQHAAAPVSHESHLAGNAIMFSHRAGRPADGPPEVCKDNKA